MELPKQLPAILKTLTENGNSITEIQTKTSDLLKDLQKDSLLKKSLHGLHQAGRN